MKKQCIDQQHWSTSDSIRSVWETCLTTVIFTAQTREKLTISLLLPK